MKRLLLILMAAAMVMGCAACAPNDSSKEGDVASDDSMTQNESKDGSEPGDEAKVIEAYREALTVFCDEHKYPDGTEYEYYDDFGDMSENKFAVIDIDIDGTDELIISFTTSPVAGMFEGIYQYDAKTGEFKEELIAFPSLKFYTNGTVISDWSHNQGLAGGDFWPYNVYSYDSETDTYKLTASADAWSKSVSETDYDGNPFPDDIDRKNIGTVFLIMQGDDTKTVSQSDYDSWISGILGGADKMTPVYSALTKENIEKLK